MLVSMPLSTEEVAQLVGISRVTLERWLASGKIPLPKTLRIGKSKFRHWSNQDIKRLKQYKARFYRKGRGRKKQR